MEMRCMSCRHQEHEYCIEVGCVCLECMGQDKDEYPLEYPSYLGGSRVCGL